ncbi:MAG: DNA translocase FtsK 4TM domain-containing protein, partial [Herbaspirillum sp.]
MSKTSQAHIRTNKTPAPPMPNRLVRLLSEARWLALAALLAYLALILLSYAKTDPGWSVASSVPRVGNWGGR